MKVLKNDIYFENLSGLMSLKSVLGIVQLNKWKDENHRLFLLISLKLKVLFL
jgi:hypothetical protein